MERDANAVERYPSRRSLLYDPPLFRWMRHTVDMTVRQPKEKAHQFLSGAGRAIDLFGSKSCLLDYFDLPEDDEALMADWAAVGGYLRGASKKYLATLGPATTKGPSRVRFIRDDKTYRLELVPNKLYFAGERTGAIVTSKRRHRAGR